MKRRILALVLMLAMLLPCLMGEARAATSGKCGTNATWKFDESTGILTISGTGAMKNYYSDEDIPWNGIKESIKKIEIKDGITTICDSAFQGAVNATSVTIPDSVTKIGFAVFSGCRSLKNASIPGSVRSMDDCVFADCTNLETVTLEEGVTTISGYMFDGCASLKHVNMPDSLTEILSNAFWRCDALEEITIPKNVKSIALPAFTECYRLKKIQVDSTNKYYSSVDGVLFDKDQKTLLVFTKDRDGHYTIPNGVTSIAYSAFYGSRNLDSITIPESVTEIDTFAFGLCDSLTSVIIPNSLSELPGAVFQFCANLKTVLLPKAITKIGNGAFGFCEMLTDVYYEGSESERNNISILQDNETLKNATWHYGYEDTIALKCSADTSTGKPKPTWSELMGAEKYRIYRATSKTGTYSYLATSTGTSYIDTSAVAGTNYYYKVKALDTDTDTYSAYSNIVNRVCDLSKPVVSQTVNAATGKPVVKWETVEGAAKYYVYRSTSKSSGYEKVYTGVKARKYEDADAVAGTNYYYKVMAIHEKSSANSAYSSVVNRVCDLAKPTVTLTRTDAGNPWVKWTAVEDADGYEVWRATSKSGTYKKVKATVSGTSFADRDVTEGKTYYYKVRAIHDNTSANSAYSAIKYITAK